MSDTTPTPVSKRQRGRSPSYPAIDLEKAIQRARSIWTKDKGYSTSVLTTVQGWGYANLNGPGGLAIAALKKFGLVEEEGSKDERMIKLSGLALRILNHPSTDARREAIREAAMIPTIHREMWDRYGADLPSDANMYWMLERERNFTDTGAREFVKEYRDTLQFAGLLDDPLNEAAARRDLVDDETPDEAPSEIPDEAPRERGTLLQRALEDRDAYGAQLNDESRVRRARADFGIEEPTTSVPIPLPGGGAIVLQAVLPISEANWNYFTTVLEVMKAGLVEGPAAPAEPDE